MKKIVLTLVAILVGLILSCFVVKLCNDLNQWLFPATHITPTIEDTLEDAKNSPLAEKWLVILGFAASSFFGGYVAGRMAPVKNKIMAALIVGFILLLGGLIYFILYPLPIWMAIISCSSYLLFSYLGGRVSSLPPR